MYEIYPRNLARASSPMVSVTKLGRITMNAAAARILAQRNAVNVFLMWDAVARKFALKPTDKSDSTTYQVRFAPENVGAGFSAKPFLRIIGYDFVETRALPTVWIEAEEMLEVTLPQEGFNRQRFPRVRKGRRDNCEKGNTAAAGTRS